MKEKLLNQVRVTKLEIVKKISSYLPYLFTSKRIKELPDQQCCFPNLIDDPENILSSAPKLVDLPWGGVNPKFYGYTDSFLGSLQNSFQTFLGTPDDQKTIVFENVLYDPKERCLYDATGKRISSSCNFRLKGRTANATQSKKSIEVPKKLRKVSGTAIYVGYFQIYHYGLFMTESISRLWYLAKNLEHPVLVQGVDQRLALRQNYIDFFFKMAGLDNERLIHFSTPTLIEKVIVPYPSVSLECEIFDAQKLVPEAIANNYLQEREVSPTSQPLYLSRKKMPSYKRLIYNENELEQMLAGRGCVIADLQELPLGEQIALINKHDTIISTMGSALHNILFNVTGQKNIVCLGYEDYINPNFLMYDAIKKVSATYIAGLQRDPSCNKKGNFDNQNRFVDLSLTLSALKDIDLL
ncbi:MAG: glycosyltransferase family 61 protein [Microcystis aeruginosa LG13-03]|nr:glycosyltransferase family 61 protein [Microcystis aeruginosa LG13-13]NCR06383.1 glycosyltransferase family 61 protein [Microcystis aeruginosa LG13-03]NCR64594.1 glycosyltransferase family 61 protein [Microcystis aeruginosa LG11-05]